MCLVNLFLCTIQHLCCQTKESHWLTDWCMDWLITVHRSWWTQAVGSSWSFSSVQIISSFISWVPTPSSTSCYRPGCLPSRLRILYLFIIINCCPRGDAGNRGVHNL